MTERSLRTSLIIGCSLVLAVMIAGMALGVRGAGGVGVATGLVLTARLAFVLFFLSYVAGPLVALFGPAFLPLRRLARDAGLAFAAVLFVHLCLVARLCWIGDAPDRSVFILFGSAALATYGIVLLSFRGVARYLSDGLIRSIRGFGMNLIAYAFAVDFLRAPLSGDTRHVVFYLPFAVLSLAGPALRLAEGLKYMDGLLRNSPYRIG